MRASVDTAVMLEQMLVDPSSGLDAPAAILLETVQGEGLSCCRLDEQRKGHGK
jgi:4-aminobutyrate aminotransferase-like enzyme